MKTFCAYLALLLMGFGLAETQAVPPAYFRINIVDSQTGRGVPLVELETVNHVIYQTDSSGTIAFYEPGLMNQKVFFYLHSHGYEIRKDGFGYAGFTLQIKEGGSIDLPIKRNNIAERLYRVTGGGLYRDTILLGDRPPIKEPALNGQVFGQDSVMAVKYRNKIYWFWGDTIRPKYPLGQFHTSGATSDLPGDNGLFPALGVDLKYFVDAEGFSKEMCPSDESNPIWIDGVLVLADENKREKLICHYTRVKDLATPLEHGLMVFNDEKQVFEKWVPLSLNDKLRCPHGHPFQAGDNGKDYLYFPDPFPNLRVRADLEHLKDPNAYESFTCLEPGTTYNRVAARVERDQAGQVVYAWKQGTSPTGINEERDLIKAGKLNANEARFQPNDVDSGKPVTFHAGSVYFNDYKKMWIAIAVQVGGASSHLGEIWFAEAPSAVGPWKWAKKILTHDRYSFYNPTQHPFFDSIAGRIIYFEGTYTADFSGNTVRTPRYDYNQIMYRLDLSDPRLQLPQ